jgi:pimeloyl-ACP methyl ester carboxylesterase
MLLSRDRQVHLYPLEDGHQLAFNRYGEPLGYPVLYFHGTPSSRLEAAFLHETAARLGLLLIAPDRPGCGISDPKPDHTLLDVGSDMAEFVDHLGWDEFGMIATSGGFPSMAACAYTFPARVRFTVDLAGWAPLNEMRRNYSHMAPGDRFFAFLARFTPRLLILPFRWIGRAARQPDTERFHSTFASWLSDSDRRLLQNHELAATLHRLVRESFRQGAGGPARDALLCYRDWGFPLGSLQVPLHIYHGQDDKLVPVSFSHYVSQAVESASLTTYPDTGHYGLILHKHAEILEEIRRLYLAG